MKREGVWTLTVDLEADRFYQFRYLCDGIGTNDNHADAYVHNRYGSDNFVVVIDPLWKNYVDDSSGGAHLSEMQERSGLQDIKHEPC